MKEKNRKRILPTILLTILLSIVLLVIVFLVTAKITPVPVARMIRGAFETAPQTPPPQYHSIQNQVTVTTDIVYADTNLHPSWKHTVLDLYRPTEQNQPLPVILWVHGGAYVGGDKTDLSIYATMLASKGYAVASINYDLAPEEKFPTPLLQLQTAHDFLQEHQEDYNLSMSQLVIAGDSAGAQIAAQWAVSQTNPLYAKEYGYSTGNTSENINAMLLFCGPYDINKFSQSDSRIVDFFLNQVARAYLGERHWKDSTEAKSASVVDFVTEDFPPSFITDGNTASFQSHGVDFAQALREKSVPVHTLFFPEERTTYHEYQFLLDTPEGEQALEETLAFLQEYLPITE